MHSPGCARDLRPPPLTMKGKVAEFSIFFTFSHCTQSWESHFRFQTTLTLMYSPVPSPHCRLAPAFPICNIPSTPSFSLSLSLSVCFNAVAALLAPPPIPRLALFGSKNSEARVTVAFGATQRQHAQRQQKREEARREWLVAPQGRLLHFSSADTHTHTHLKANFHLKLQMKK